VLQLAFKTAHRLVTLAGSRRGGQLPNLGFTCASLTTARQACIVSGLLLLSYLLVTSLSIAGPASGAAGHIHSHHDQHSDTDISADAAPSSGAMHMMMQMYFEVRRAAFFVL
jgi:hypothetical protein